jgi:hypothetical protein
MLFKVNREVTECKINVIHELMRNRIVNVSVVVSVLRESHHWIGCMESLVHYQRLLGRECSNVLGRLVEIDGAKAERYKDIART